MHVQNARTKSLGDVSVICIVLINSSIDVNTNTQNHCAQTEIPPDGKNNKKHTI